jgi:RHS repeat-associated protein
MCYRNFILLFILIVGFFGQGNIEASAPAHVGEVKNVVTDHRNNTRTITYNQLGQVEKIVERNSHGEIFSERQMVYDEKGNKIRESQEVHGRTPESSTYTLTWAYDDDHRLIAVTEGIEHSHPRRTAYEYSSAGILEKIIKPDGLSLKLRFGREGNLVRLTSSDRTIDYSYDYDDKGHAIKAIDHTKGTSTQRSYDAKGRILSEVFAHGHGLTYTYDTEGGKRSILPDQSSILYFYENHRLSTIHRLSASGELTYALDVTPGDLQQQDGKGSLDDITPTPDTAVQGPLCVARQLSHMPWGKIEQTYTYDTCGQIIQEEGIISRSYAYDSLKNRIVQDGEPWAIDALNQLVATGTCTYRWDQNGNCIARQCAEDQSERLYAFDALNRLTSVTNPGHESFEYSYDPFHRRVSKTEYLWDSSTGTWEEAHKYYYIYDGEREIAALDGEGSICQLRILKDAFSDIAAACAIEIQGHPYRPLHDASGSICALIDMSTDQPCEYYLYTAFGEMRIFDADGVVLECSLVGNPWLYFSKRLDAESGCFFFGMRYYAPAMGRWTSADPIGFVDGANRFVFLGNDPLTNRDLYGLFCISDMWSGGQNFLSALYDTFSACMYTFRDYCSFETHASNNFVSWSSEGLGASFLHMIGYHGEQPEVGTIGLCESNDKVRITFVNGMLNTRPDVINSAQMISDTHGGTNVHYIFRPTLGWSWDLIKSVFVKSGYIFPDTQLLAETWRALIEDMGGIEGGGTIIHYAHSIGSADSYSAQQLLTPDEQQMIKVITFGSPTLQPNDGFHSISHYISVRDGVPLIDIAGRIGALFRGDEHIIPVGSYIGIPFVDHLLDSHTYRGVIEALGREFKSLYGR